MDRQIGGVQIQTESMRAAMVRAGHEVVLVTPFDGSALLPTLAAAAELPLRLHTSTQQAWRLWWHGRLLRRHLRRAKHLIDGTHPTVIVAQCGFSANEAHRFRSPNVPLVLVAH